MKFVKKLTEREQQALEQMRDKHRLAMTRKRAHSLLLSQEGYRLGKISEILVQESGSFHTTQKSKKSDFLKKSDFSMVWILLLSCTRCL